MIGENTDLFRIALNSSPTGLWLSDQTGGLIYLNQTLIDWTGIPYKDLLGTGWASAIIDDDRQRAVDVFLTAIAARAHYDVMFRIRKGTGEVIWCRAAGDPYNDAHGNYAGYSGFCMDMNQIVTIENELTAGELRFRSIVEQAPMAIGLLKGRDLIVEVGNDRIFELWGKDKSIIGKKLVDALPEIKDQGFLELLDDVYTTGIPHHGNGVRAKLVRKKELQDGYFDFAYTPVKDGKGNTTGIMVLATEVTEKVRATKAIEESEAKLQFAIDATELGTWDLVPATNKFSGNDRLKEWFGLQPESEIDLTLALNVIAERDKERVTHAIQKALTVESGGDYDIEYTIINPHTKSERIVKAKGKAWFTPEKIAHRFNGTLQDVTKEVRARQAVEENENRLRSLVESAPFPIGVYVGREMLIWLANQSIVDIWAKGSDVIGKRYAEILPELSNQKIFQELDEVFTSGIALHRRNQRVDISIDGKLKAFYFNYSFSPLFNPDGTVYGVMNTAAEITDLVEAKLMVEQTSEALKGAVELAELGTWDIDLVNRTLNYSDRLLEWFAIGKHEVITVERAYQPIVEKDRHLVRDAILHSITPGTNGIYDVEYSLSAIETGRERIIHAQGKSYFNERGEAYKISGTAQDVTAQRKAQLALEQEVQKRTEELALSNEEIQATNEELASTNEELAESNENLLRSNHELEQYAYVASHDLQEPLRKIRMYSDLLLKQGVPESGERFLDKIKQSSERMSLLIHDLLSFSRLLKSDSLVQRINLSQILAEVIKDFELAIEEKGAIIHAGKLPEIEAIGLQMNQLFYNLFSNALKFTRSGPAPRIDIDSVIIPLSEVKKYIAKPFTFADYYHIRFSDNGIGLQPQYAEHIFEIFKRLHGRDAYPGSGIGLALCRRIVTSHGGYIFVESEEGKGSTFHLILPDKRKTYQASVSEWVQ